MSQLSPHEQAAAFLHGMYEAMAHGDEEHKAWLFAEVARWAQPLTRILQETHERGYKLGRKVDP